MRRSIASLTTVSLALMPHLARAQDAAEIGEIPNYVLYIILALVFGSAIIGILTIRNVLMRPGGTWSLTDALSEEVDFFGIAPQPAAARANADNAAAAAAGAVVGAAVGAAAAGDTTTAVVVQPPPERVTRMVASSSRLIALLGLIGILALFLGFGLVLIWQVARGAAVKEAIDSISDYLLYGVVMFAPYLVNKFSSVFSTFAK